MNTIAAKACVLTGLLFLSNVYAWTNSHTIILQTKRANIQDIIPILDCSDPNESCGARITNLSTKQAKNNSV